MAISAALTNARLTVTPAGAVVCESCTVADRPLARMRGLMGRAALDRGHGLLLSPAPSIHTFFMRFPIDALFLDSEMRVVRVVSHMRPWRTAMCRGARSVVELPAGEAARLGVVVGDHLELDGRGS
jgi:uncharacterized protein